MINLIASENVASQAVRDLCGSTLTDKYAEGYPGKRYYNGCEEADKVETQAIEAAKSLFNVSYANVQPHSGSNANLAVFYAFLKPGDTTLGMDLSSGGHLSHGAKVNISGSYYDAHYYGLVDGKLDYDNILEIAQKVRPKMLIAGASAYPGIIDWERFRYIADKVDALLLVDMAHYSGLIAGGAYPSPTCADIITSTTHKTLRGPRGGIILWNNSAYNKINSAVFPGIQGGPFMNVIAAKAQCFQEASTDEFKEYAHQVIRNARAMCTVFSARDMPANTDSHIILLKVDNGKKVADKLEKHGIIVNKNAIPNDPRSFLETSGIRIGTAAETTKGHDEEWFKNLAHRIVDICKYT